MSEALWRSIWSVVFVLQFSVTGILLFEKQKVIQNLCIQGGNKRGSGMCERLLD